MEGRRIENWGIGGDGGDYEGKTNGREGIKNRRITDNEGSSQERRKEKRLFDFPQTSACWCLSLTCHFLGDKSEVGEPPPRTPVPGHRVTFEQQNNLSNTLLLCSLRWRLECCCQLWRRLWYSHHRDACFLTCNWRLIICFPSFFSVSVCLSLSSSFSFRT